MDPIFSQLMETAALLTPFAAEARYDTEFWPTPDTVKEAELAASRIARLIASLVQSADAVLPTGAEEWREALDRFNWRVDLMKFKDAKNHPGFFNRVIEPNQVAAFEDSFRAELVPGGNVERAAEVTYWKNGRNYKARDRITRDLLTWIRSEEHWMLFVVALKHLAEAPTWELFGQLVRSCGQTSGFATPITFLSFYDPERFPMVDRKIGVWWRRRFQGEPQFSWDPRRTRITPSPKSWNAYLAWAQFCRSEAAVLTASQGKPWRARDVEMAVWSDKDCKLPVA